MDRIPHGDNVATRMVANIDTTELNTTQQVDVVKLFDSIQQEAFEEECSNLILPCPYHPELDAVPGKHATCCLAAGVHLLLCK